MIVPNSRNKLTDIVQPSDPVDLTATRPPFVYLRERVTDFGADDSFQTLDDSQDWGTLARDSLGDAALYWVIADLTGIVDTFDEFTTGTQVRIPSQYRLLFGILAPQNQKS